MSAHRGDDLDNGIQGSANADEQRRTSFSSGMTTLDTPPDYCNNVREIPRICGTGSPDDYHNPSPVWVGWNLSGSQAPASYATTQTSLSAWGSQPCMPGSESDGQSRPVLSPGYPIKGHSPCEDSWIPTREVLMDTSHLSGYPPCELINRVLKAAYYLYSYRLRDIVRALNMPEEPNLAVIEGLQVIDSWLYSPGTLTPFVVIRLLFMAQAVSLGLGGNFQHDQQICHEGQRLILQLPLVHGRVPLCDQINALCGQSETQQVQPGGNVMRTGDSNNSFVFNICAHLLTLVQESPADCSLLHKRHGFSSCARGGRSVYEAYRGVIASIVDMLGDSSGLIECCATLVDSQATQPSDSRMTSGQVEQPPSLYPSGDKVSRDNLDDTYYKSSLPPSPSDQLCVPMNHKLPSPQHPTASHQSFPLPAPNRPVPASPPQTPSDQCPYPHCGRLFKGESRRGNMSRHMRTKHGISSRVAREFPCADGICKKTFKRKDARLNHERKAHPELGRMSAVPRKPFN